MSSGSLLLLLGLLTLWAELTPVSSKIRPRPPPKFSNLPADTIHIMPISKPATKTWFHSKFKNMFKVAVLEMPRISRPEVHATAPVLADQ